MDEKIAIRLSNISKKYILHHEKPTLIESLFVKKEEFWALRKINLVVKKGERLGVIGANGAGKSTLLKIIVGITAPTTGEVEVKGKVVSLIDLEAGFYSDLTGEENIFINGLLLGMTTKQIKKNFNSIVNFSGIRKFIDTPLHTYSDGMKLRLGFSIAAYSEFDILIIDEVTSYSDEEFRIKSYQKMKEFLKMKKTIIFVSHNLDILKQYCSKMLWLKKGRIVLLDSTEKVIFRYLKS